MPTYSELRAMSAGDLNTAIDQIVSNRIHELTEASEFCNCSAGTNADGWMIDDYHLDDPDFDDDLKEIRIPLSFHASGDQIEDMGFCGTEISGEGAAVIDELGNLSFDNELQCEITGLD